MLLYALHPEVETLDLGMVIRLYYYLHPELQLPLNHLYVLSTKKTELHCDYIIFTMR